jgi:outer membrane protein assembly factor BamB
MLVPFALACGLVTAALFAADPAGQWPQYRGPNGWGIATTSGPVQFGLKENLLWSVEIPHGHSSPSISGNLIFLTSFDKSVKKLEILAIDLKNGKIAWRRPVSAATIEKVHEVSSPATATPIVDGDRVYTYFGSTGLVCHDRTGKLLWTAPMPTAKASFGSGASPALAGDVLIIPRDDTGESKLMAIDKNTGKELWQAQLSGGGDQGRMSGHATPVIWKDEVVMHLGGEIAGYALKDGAKKWWLPLATEGTSTPVIVGDTAYVGASGSEPELRDPIPDYATLLRKYDKNSDGQVDTEEFPSDLAGRRRIDAGTTPGAVVTFKQFIAFIDSNKDSKVDKAEWDGIVGMITKPSPLPLGTLAIHLGGEKQLGSSSIVWSEPRAVPEVPMALVYKDRVYTISNGGIASAYDAKTGKVLFRGRVGAGGLYYASPIAAGDRIYFASDDGVVTVITAGDKLEVLANNDLGEPIFATPAVVNGYLYVRTTAHLYAFSGGL